MPTVNLSLQDMSLGLSNLFFYDIALYLHYSVKYIGFYHIIKASLRSQWIYTSPDDLKLKTSVPQTDAPPHADGRLNEEPKFSLMFGHFDM